MSILTYNGQVATYNGTILMSAEGFGGDITYYGDYKIHTFNSSSNFYVTGGFIDASVLVVGGGGHGTDYVGPTAYGAGGGGGGEVKFFNALLNTSYPVIVGSPTQDSSFYGILARGGKTGGNVGGDSGSGNIGGNPNANQAGGGGAGDASNGESTINLYGGQGGQGRYSDISGTLLGYGGGGGGGSRQVFEQIRIKGWARAGDGGMYNISVPPTDASANSGSGGGGGANSLGGRGAAGVVIIRYKYK